MLLHRRAFFIRLKGRCLAISALKRFSCINKLKRHFDRGKDEILCLKM